MILDVVRRIYDTITNGKENLSIWQKALLIWGAISAATVGYKFMRPFVMGLLAMFAVTHIDFLIRFLAYVAVTSIIVILYFKGKGNDESDVR